MRRFRRALSARARAVRLEQGCNYTRNLTS